VRYVFYAAWQCSLWAFVLVRLKGFQRLTSVEEALRKFFDALTFESLKAETIRLDSALNRVLSEEVVAGVDLPGFDRSAVDGYAVKAEETFGATQFKPKVMRLTDKDVIVGNEVKQVWTGNPVPRNANAVLMLEDVGRGKTEAEVRVCGPVAPGENVSKRGEDVRKGAVAVERGVRLKPQHMGLMGALGVSQVRVFCKPRVGVLATGDELVELGGQLRGGQVFDVNRLVLSSLCLELGAEPVDLGIAGDDVSEILEKLKLGVESADVLMTSGGTSVGGSDLVPDAVNRLGKPGILVHGVAMRPAMPIALGVVDGKPVLVFPGNPVAAMVGFEVFARPLISRMLGMRRMESRFEVQAKMTKRIATAVGRRNFVRVRVFQKKGVVWAEPVSARGSSLISTMTRANGFVVVSEDREGLDEGELVSVRMFDQMSG
jgi:molybdopterin molybdotransferase